jgi:hypothetical protein
MEAEHSSDGTDVQIYTGWSQEKINFPKLASRKTHSPIVCSECGLSVDTFTYNLCFECDLSIDIFTYNLRSDVAYQ